MHKTTARNLQRLNFRGSGQLFGKVEGFGARNKKRKQAQAERDRLRTEPELVPCLGRGPQFIQTVYNRYREEFAKLGHEPKRCSAYLNIVAQVRVLNRGLWTDKAVQSMFRRVTLMKQAPRSRAIIPSKSVRSRPS